MDGPGVGPEWSTGHGTSGLSCERVNAPKKEVLRKVER